MAGLTLSALAMLGSLASTAYGAVKSAEANTEAEARLSESRQRERRYYDRLLSRDYIQSTEAQSLLRRMQELQRKNYDRARGINTVAGGSEASLAALQSQGNDTIAQVAEGIASKADARKEKIEAAQMAADKAYSQQMFGLGQQRAQTIADASGQVSKAMAGIAAAGGDAENPYGDESVFKGGTAKISEVFPDKAAGKVTENPYDPFGISDKKIGKLNQVTSPGGEDAGLSGLEEWKKRFGIS